MADLLNTPGVNTPSQVQKKEVPYKTQVDIQNWANWIKYDLDRIQ